MDCLEPFYYGIYGRGKCRIRMTNEEEKTCQRQLLVLTRERRGIFLPKIDNNFKFDFFISDYSESDYDDSLDEYIRLKSRADPFEKEFQYGAYQAIMSGKIPHIKLYDAGNKMSVKLIINFLLVCLFYSKRRD